MRVSNIVSIYLGVGSKSMVFLKMMATLNMKSRYEIKSDIEKDIENR